MRDSMSNTNTNTEAPLEREIQQLRAEAEELLADVAALKAERDAALAENEALRAAITGSAEQSAKLMTALREADAELVALGERWASKNEALREQLADREDRYQTAMAAWDALRAEVAALKASAALSRRDLAWSIMGIDPEESCRRCGGLGRRVYGASSTWRGGPGGQTMTPGVCDLCWGTGHAKREGTDLRRVENEIAALRAEVAALKAERDAALAENEALRAGRDALLAENANMIASGGGRDPAVGGAASGGDGDNPRP